MSRSRTVVVTLAFLPLSAAACSAAPEKEAASTRDSAPQSAPSGDAASVSAEPASAGDVPPASSATASAPTASPPEPISLPAIEKVCKAAPCSGPMARIVVLRAGERVVRYLHHGDPQRCSHPPSVYFDAKGVEVGTIPMKPIRPGSDEEKKIDAEHAKLGAGGKAAEEVDCTGKVAPAN